MNNVVTKARLEKLKKLRLFDDDYAKIFFQNRDCARLVAEIVLQRKIDIIHHETEAIIEMIGGRSVEYDIFILSDKEGIDIEIENTFSRAASMRVVFHQSAMMVDLSEKGMDFKK